MPCDDQTPDHVLRIQKKLRRLGRRANARSREAADALESLDPDAALVRETEADIDRMDEQLRLMFEDYDPGPALPRAA